MVPGRHAMSPTCVQPPPRAPLPLLASSPSVRGLPYRLARWLPVLLLLIAGAAQADDSAVEALPRTKNPHLKTIASLYDNLEYEEALKVLGEAERYPNNGPGDVLWLELMCGVLHHHLRNDQQADAALRRALEQQPYTTLPLKQPSESLRMRFIRLQREVLKTKAAVPARPASPPPKSRPATDPPPAPEPSRLP